MIRSTIQVMAVVLLTACTQKSHVATSGPDGSTDSGRRAPVEHDAGTPTPEPDSGTPGTAGITTSLPLCDGPDQSPAVDWDGWIEAFTFPSGSDRLRVSMESDGAGGWTGFALPGEGPHIDGIPRSPDDCNFLCNGLIDESYFGDRVLEGFRYTLENVTHTDTRLRFDIDTNEIFDAWCRAQVVEPGEDPCAFSDGEIEVRFGDYTCFSQPHSETRTQVPCCRFWLCDHVCSCLPEGCHALPSRLTIDLFIESDVASGTTPFGTAHLERAD